MGRTLLFLMLFKWALSLVILPFPSLFLPCTGSYL